MASSGRAPASASARSNTAGAGLRAPASAEVTIAVEQRLELERAQDPVQRHVPIARHHQPLAARAGRLERRPGIRERGEAQRGEQRVEQRIELQAGRRERVAEHAGAAATEPLEAGLVAAVVEMGAVVGDLG